MTKMTTLKEPLDKHPTLCMELDDIVIMAEHFGYDFAQCKVIAGFNNNQICHIGYCLINNDGDVVDDIDWIGDDELLRKFWEYDKRHGFIEDTVSLEDFIRNARKKRA